MYVFQVTASHTSPPIKGSVMHQEKNFPCMQLHIPANSHALGMSLTPAG